MKNKYLGDLSLFRNGEIFWNEYSVADVALFIVPEKPPWEGGNTVGTYEQYERGLARVKSASWGIIRGNVNANIRELAMHTTYFTNAEVEREFSFIVMFVCYCPVTDVKRPETTFKINSYLIKVSSVKTISLVSDLDLEAMQFKVLVLKTRLP